MGNLTAEVEHNKSILKYLMEKGVTSGSLLDENIDSKLYAVCSYNLMASDSLLQEIKEKLEKVGK